MNDYNSHFVATRERPQNFILDGAADTPTRLARFPTRKELAFLKREHTAKHAFPSTRLQCDLGALKLHPGTFGNTKFDVIYVNPPWGSPNWPASKVLGLTIEQIAEPNGCFVFLWCGDGNDHTLELGRECLAKWGFRRVEEIVWLKTNHDHCGNGRDATDATGTADDDDDNACQDERKDEDDSMDCQSERKDEATPTPEEPQKTPPPCAPRRNTVWSAFAATFAETGTDTSCTPTSTWTWWCVPDRPPKTTDGNQARCTKSWRTFAKAFEG